MIKLGMLIGDRYEILEKIGTGGMSDVYKAKDHKLNRFVAVKVLKQEFSENRNFVSKFRVEAQAAAGLMHPNIVNVYDVGEEDGIHYIVMELVEGITLKKYIEKKQRLTTKEAISIAIQVAMGIEAAHNNHIIHRDIKPQNIIISKEGKVKVTDFGIAKAASSNTITSNVMGSVHYTSPEQARGGFSDEKSDIYSMGITMFEMLTGRVPFNGDTTVTIAIKHIQDPMPSIREIVPEVPVSVENIVMKCTQKSPDRRYQNMGDVIQDLKYSLVNPDAMIAVVDAEDEAGKTKVSGESRSVRNIAQFPQQESNDYYEDDASNQDNGEYDNYEPIQEQIENSNVLNRVWEDQIPQDDYLEEESNTPKSRMRKKKPAGNAKSKKSNQAKKSKQSKASKPSKKRAENLEAYDSANEKMNRQKVRQNSGDYELEDDFPDDEYDYNPKVDGLSTFLTIIAAVIIGCILLYFVAQAIGMIGDNSGITDSNSTTQTTESQSSSSSTSGKNTKTTEVPAVVGLTEAEATAALKAEGFSVTKTQEFSTEFERGIVISQSPSENSEAPLESEVTLVISSGSESVEVKMPTVTGLDKAAAVSSLETAGLEVGEITEEYSDYPEGKISYQSYAGGTSVAEGTTVDLKISLGPETVTYSCNAVVNAPIDYVAGLADAEVMLSTEDGTEIWRNSKVTSFPVQIKCDGFESSTSTGIITITYVVYAEVPVTDSDGNVTTQTVADTAQITQSVTFSKN